MKIQEGEKLEEEGNRLVTLEWSWILISQSSQNLAGPIFFEITHLPVINKYELTWM